MTLCTKKKRTARPNHLSRPPRWRLARPESVSFQGARFPRQAPPGTLPPRPRPRPRVPRPLPRPRFMFGPLSTSPPLPLAPPSPPPSFSLLRSNVFSSVPSAMLEGRYGRPCLGQEHFRMEISNLCGGVFSLEIRKLRESRPSSSGSARKAKGSGAQGSDVLREAPRSSEPKRPGEGRTAR